MKKMASFNEMVNGKVLNRFIIGLGSLIFIYMAFKSSGYYHADEHYQIIEFAGEKLGTHKSNDLVWEYQQRIRPTIQPTIVYVSLSIFKSIGISNPYHQTLILRLLTAGLAILVLLYFNRSVRYFLRNNTSKIILLFLTFSLWFIPFLSVRFSSETWSGLLFLLGLSILLQQKNKINFLLLGLVLGLSILFRYQIALSIIGLVLWLIFIKKTELKSIIFLGIAMIIMVVIGTVVDSWFYGELTVVPWRYLMAVIETSGEGFGQSPWYFYFTSLISTPNYIIGIPITLLICISFFYNKANLLFWCIVPFLLFHSFIPHKEIRFLFPLAFMIPFLIILSYDKVYSITSQKKIWRNILNISASILLAINLVVLGVSSQKSAGMARTTLTEYIHSTYGSQPINLIHTAWHNPYNPWNSLEQIFYSENQLTTLQIKSVYDLTDSLLKPNQVNLLIANSNTFDDSDKTLFLEKNGFTPVSQNMPTWVFQIIKYSQPKSEIKLLILYELQSHL